MMKVSKIAVLLSSFAFLAASNAHAEQMTWESVCNHPFVAKRPFYQMQTVSLKNQQPYWETLTYLSENDTSGVVQLKVYQALRLHHLARRGF